MDNARVHTAAKVKQPMQAWQKRGLYLFYPGGEPLPPYSPQLNIAERLWKELKARWLKPEDYLTGDHLFYAVNLAMAAVGKSLFINFSDYQL
jgi:transposase